MPSLMDRAVDYACRFLTWLSAGLLLAVLVVVFMQVMFRYVLNMAVPWTEEAARYLNIWMVFLGGAVAVAHDSHLKVTYFIDKLSGFPRLLLQSVILLVTLGFNVIILLGSIRLISLNWQQSATTFPVSVGVLYASVACYALFAIAFGIYLLVRPRSGRTKEAC